MPKETLGAKRARKTRPAKPGRRAQPDLQPAVVAQSEEGPSEGNDQLFHLPEILDLAAAAPLARELLARRGRPTIIDAVASKQPGTWCVQVLLSAIRTWDHDRVPLTFVNCESSLTEHFRFLGLDPGVLLKGVQS